MTSSLSCQGKSETLGCEANTHATENIYKNKNKGSCYYSLFSSSITFMYNKFCFLLNIAEILDGYNLNYSSGYMRCVEVQNS